MSQKTGRIYQDANKKWLLLSNELDEPLHEGASPQELLKKAKELGITHLFGLNSGIKDAGRNLKPTPIDQIDQTWIDSLPKASYGAHVNSKLAGLGIEVKNGRVRKSDESRAISAVAEIGDDDDKYGSTLPEILLNLAGEISISPIADYSGRGMVGETCYAVTVSQQDYKKAFEVIRNRIPGTRSDNLGHDMIIYWPSVSYEKINKDLHSELRV